MGVVAVVGCQPDDTGAVLLHLNARSDASTAPATYSSSTAAAAFAPDGLVTLTATSNQGVVTLLLAGPLGQGDMIALPPAEERVHFQIRDDGWGNQGGTIEVLSVNPVIVSFVGVPMVARAGAATGSFVFDGGGTFR
ncbi:MAG TPA: hypothetical protein VF945_11560 [Polyangia bacterium]